MRTRRSALLGLWAALVRVGVARADAGPPLDGVATDAPPPDAAAPAPDFSAAECATNDDCDANPWARTCAGGACVECAGDEDCAANESAFGPRCVAGRCRCSSEFECLGNPNGPRCVVGFEGCACLGDIDCAPEATCVTATNPYLAEWDVRTCSGPAPATRDGGGSSPREDAGVAAISPDSGKKGGEQGSGGCGCGMARAPASAAVPWVLALVLVAILRGARPG